MSKKLILHLCADIGSDSKPYQDRPDEYEVICVGQKIGVENYTPPSGVYGVIANPPCTHFSIARHANARVKRDLMEGMRLVKECQRIIWTCASRVSGNNIKSDLNFWMIENPSTGALKYFLGKPTFQYCPSEYGEPYTKRTALWGWFNAPKKPFYWGEKLKGKSLAKDVISKVGFKGTSSDLTNLRSMCSQKFAKAFFEANR